MWDELTSFENLYLSYKKASKGRRSRPDIAAFEISLEKNLLELREDLISEVYEHGKYHSFYIHDPKKRLISAADFRDRIVHHAVVSVLEPIYEKQFLANSYANRTGKGTHKALNYCAKMMKKYQYYLFMDVKQFFPSIDHEILFDLLAREIDCEKTLKLCEIILKSGEDVLGNEYEMVWFPGDDLFSILRPRGLPIGNMSSQFWANVYLHELDLYMSHVLGAETWARYVDDLVVFSNDKGKLWNIRRETIKFLEKLRLVIHEGSAQPTPTSQGITFLGFRIFPEYARLKRQKLINANRKISDSLQATRNAEITEKHFQDQLRGWLNHVRWGNTWHLRNNFLHRLGIHAWYVDE